MRFSAPRTTPNAVRTPMATDPSWRGRGKPLVSEDTHALQPPPPHLDRLHRILDLKEPTLGAERVDALVVRSSVERPANVCSTHSRSAERRRGGGRNPTVGIVCMTTDLVWYILAGSAGGGGDSLRTRLGLRSKTAREEGGWLRLASHLADPSLTHDCTRPGRRTAPLLIKRPSRPPSDCGCVVPGVCGPALKMESQTPLTREAANALFKSGDFRGAVAAYSALLGTELKLVAAAEPPQSLSDEAITLLGNRALCHIRLGDPAAADADCTSILNVQPGAEKALYRRALAREVRG